MGFEPTAHYLITQLRNRPLYKRRSQLLSETQEVEEGDEVEIEQKEAPVQGIPGFWSRVLLSEEDIETAIKDRDLECLNHLLDIQAEPQKQGGIKLVFSFSTNPFFSNKVYAATTCRS